MSRLRDDYKQHFCVTLRVPAPLRYHPLLCGYLPLFFIPLSKSNLMNGEIVNAFRVTLGN